MFKDLEDNTVEIAQNPNGHMLVLGKSGTGKTYFLCQEIRKEIKDGKSVLIFDYSNSYCYRELKGNGFVYLGYARIYNPLKCAFSWVYEGRNMEVDITNILVKILGIHSYKQCMALSEAIHACVSRDEMFSLKCCIKEMERMYEDAEGERKAALSNLLMRCRPIVGEREIFISKKREEAREKGVMLNILQLSDLSSQEKNFWTYFFAELFWLEVKVGKKKADIVVFDEFQHLSFKNGDALSEILREGRKFDVAGYFSSQFVGECTQDEINALMQAGSMMFFQPTARDLGSVAYWIDCNNIAGWKKILRNLKVGEAVLVGNHKVNGNQISESPIICKIVFEQEHLKMKKILTQGSLNTLERGKLREKFI